MRRLLAASSFIATVEGGEDGEDDDEDEDEDKNENEDNYEDDDGDDDDREGGGREYKFQKDIIKGEKRNGRKLETVIGTGTGTGTGTGLTSGYSKTESHIGWHPKNLLLIFFYEDQFATPFIHSIFNFISLSVFLFPSLSLSMHIYYIFISLSLSLSLSFSLSASLSLSLPSFLALYVCILYFPLSL